MVSGLSLNAGEQTQFKAHVESPLLAIPHTGHDDSQTTQADIGLAVFWS